MSDPIGNIIWGEDYFSNPHDDEIIKQIRQQIGREIIAKLDADSPYSDFPEVSVREICQLEEE